MSTNTHILIRSLIVFLCLCLPCQSAILDFDHLTPFPYATQYTSEGFVISAFITDGSESGSNVNGIHSGPYAATYLPSFKSVNGYFNINSLYATSSFESLGGPLDVPGYGEIEYSENESIGYFAGFADGIPKYFQAVVINTLEPTLIEFDWGPIDRLSVLNSDAYTIVDDLSFEFVSQVPLPASLLTFLTSLFSIFLANLPWRSLRP